MKDFFRKEIILIGPIKAGKSTLSSFLSDYKPKSPILSLDDLRWGEYGEYPQFGYDNKRAYQIEKKEGFMGLYRYWKQFEIKLVEKSLTKYKDCIFNFGGGHSVYEDPDHFSRAERVLKPFINVFLIMPSIDKDESIAILNSEIKNPQVREVNEHFVRHESNYLLAKKTVFTKGKSPKETAEEILELSII